MEERRRASEGARPPLGIQVRRRVALLCVLLVLSWAAPLGARQVGEANRWTCEGGSPSRSGAVATAPLLDSVAVGWEFPADGTIVGEPLAWDDVVYVETLAPGGERAIVALDRLTGVELSRWSKRSDLPLLPSLHGRKVLVRSAPDTFVGLLLERGRLKLAWSQRASAEVTGLLLVGTRVVVQTTEGVDCHEWSRRLLRKKPLWSQPGEHFGRACASDGVVYLCRRTGERNEKAAVGGYRLDSGERTRTFPAFQPHRDEVDVRVLAIAGELALHRPTAGGVRSLREPRRPFLDLTGVPADLGDGSCIGATEGDFLLHARAGRDPEPLANRESNPALLAGVTVPSVAGGIVLLGSSALDVGTREVRWSVPLAPVRRAVPVEQGVLLVVEGGARLVCLQPVRRVVAWAPPDLVTDGTVVTARGEVERGDVELADGEVHVGKSAWPADEVLVVLDANGAPRHAPAPAALRRGLAVLWDAELVDEVLALAEEARGSRDADLVEALATRAEDLGADDKRLAKLEQAVETLRRKGKSVREEEATATRTAWDALERGRGAKYWAAREAAGDDAPVLFTDELLAAVLAHDPGHAGVQDVIRTALADGVAPAGAFDPGPWLDFLRVNRRTRVAFARGEPGDDPEVVRVLAKQRVHWRADLVAFASDRIVVVTPVREPGQLARVLGIGELVCDVLEELVGAPREAAGRLLLLLAADKDEYLRISGEDPEDSALAWTAGHYSPSEGLARLFFPSREGAPAEAASAEVVETFVHELTHMWMDQRCAFTPAEPDLAGRLERPGYWLVEGFACLLEGFQFDPVEGVWSSASVRDRYLDTWASARRRIELASFCRASQRDFHFADAGPVESVPSSFLLGMARRVDFRARFYVQAASLCHWLHHADEGANRGRLLELLRAYYAADGAGALHELLGLTAEDLEAAVTEHALDTLGRDR